MRKENLASSASSDPAFIEAQEALVHLLRIREEHSARITAAEGAFHQVEADIACAEESLREMDGSSIKNFFSFLSTSRKDNRAALTERLESLKATRLARRKELETACLDRALLKEQIGKIELRIKQARQQANRLFDPAEC